MRIAVVGGKLQGVEVVYLALKAGFETLLIDRHTDVPAGAMARQFTVFDFQSEGIWPTGLGKIDLVFPALEDLRTLELLERWAHHLQVPIVLDLEAFRVSNSKTLSNAVFKKCHLPIPAGRADGSFPLVVKPDQASGSEGIEMVSSERELESLLRHYPGDVVIQEFLEGPSFSIEVIGTPGHYHTLEVTDLFMDKDHDCSGAAAPSALEDELKKALQRAAVAVATEISLHGIMDLETILHDGEHKLLEIDARFPSQTPIVVYLATGTNMVEMLAHLFLRGFVPARPAVKRHARMDHIRVNGRGVDVCGEHIMAKEGPLRLVTDFFGAGETLTTCAPGKQEWVATLMFTAADRVRLASKREQCLRQIASNERRGGSQ